MQKGVLRNFTKFTGKHLCQSLLLINFVKKEALAQGFLVNFVQFTLLNLTAFLNSSVVKFDKLDIIY